MGMSDSERRLLLSGTLDTSGVGGGDHERLPEVAVAWGTGAELAQPEPEPEAPEQEPETPETPEAPEPVKAPDSVPKPAARKSTTAKKTTAPKTQATKPAES